ncbi:amidohydrolase family protein [Fusarium langsethiae]|uniref:Peptidase M20 domain-containing protein 2 n=1 Tax=Fusarium langsethiae TaxID=179993 RepID=A0A0M9ERU2_FUSLA|nr:amidohydrolase family protein [Fusarium langsethiae]
MARLSISDKSVDGEKQPSISHDEIRNAIKAYLHSIAPKIEALNRYIHGNPELAFQEHKAHDAIADFLEELGYRVTRHAYDLKTSFEVISGNGGRLVNFNAEYDALPGLGHACGHNLIATASITGFVALSHVLRHFGVAGRVQLLGTPAEEDGGGKIALLSAGAHPMSENDYTKRGVLGCAGFLSVASYNIQGTYHGVSAHAGATPWEGINALDALVSAYVNVSMLRQQILPTQRINGAIVEAPKPSSNAIPALTKTEYTARSPTIRGARNLASRIRQCLEAGALATGCKVDIEEKSGYADLRVNEVLCSSFLDHIAADGIKLLKTDEPVSAATDQGNVSYAVPSLHAVIGIPAADGSKNHTAGFTKAAGTTVAYERAVISGKAMALTGWDVLTSDGFYDQVKQEFEKDREFR